MRPPARVLPLAFPRAGTHAAAPIATGGGAGVTGASRATANARTSVVRLEGRVARVAQAAATVGRGASPSREDGAEVPASRGRAGRGTSRRGARFVVAPAGVRWSQHHHGS